MMKSKKKQKKDFKNQKPLEFNKMYNKLIRKNKN